MESPCLERFDLQDTIIIATCSGWAGVFLFTFDVWLAVIVTAVVIVVITGRRVSKDAVASLLMKSMRCKQFKNVLRMHKRGFLLVFCLRLSHKATWFILV